MPRKVPRQEISSVHGSLLFRVVTTSYLSPRIQIVVLKVPTSHPLTKGHSGAQLVQYGNNFVPKENLRDTRRVENYILKSAVFGKPPEKGYFIFYILSFWVIERK